MKNKFIVYGLLAGGIYLGYKHFTKKSKMDINDINVLVDKETEMELESPVIDVPIKPARRELKELIKDKAIIGKSVGMWSSRDAKSYMDRFQ